MVILKEREGEAVVRGWGKLPRAWGKLLMTVEDGAEAGGGWYFILSPSTLLRAETSVVGDFKLFF